MPLSHPKFSSTINLINFPISVGSPILPDGKFFIIFPIFTTFELSVLKGPGAIFTKHTFLFNLYCDTDFKRLTKPLLNADEDQPTGSFTIEVRLKTYPFF